MKSKLALYISNFVHKSEKKWIDNPTETQEKLFRYLLSKAKNTQFGKDHNFDEIKTYEDFKKQVPVRDYEELRPYIEEIRKGKSDILWKGKPDYFAKTSGTTSGVKYIPLTKKSIRNHIRAARNVLMEYIYKTQKPDFFSGKMIFLQGSPILKEENGIKIGRLSGIVAHYVPSYLQKNRMPSWDTNCIEDWEEKIEKISEETIKENMTLISGIPPWLVMYYEKMLELSNKKTLIELFPELQVIATGGVSYDPYRTRVNELLGKEIDILQTYPASEGFIGYQNDLEDESLLLLLDHGIFYEFIPMDEYFDENPTRISLKDVELNKDYALILSTIAGLWGYSIGDVVKFTSINPYKIIVSGRIKHFTSAFGEHVIAHEVETALANAIEKYPANIVEFTIAPQVNPSEGLPYHEWIVEFEKEPTDMNLFALELDKQLRSLNAYYDELISGKVLRELKISKVNKDGFHAYMKSKKKLGGQNKMPRLSNNREIADDFYEMKLIG